jgi:hypothetical protein
LRALVSQGRQVSQGSRPERAAAELGVKRTTSSASQPRRTKRRRQSCVVGASVKLLLNNSMQL